MPLTCVCGNAYDEVHALNCHRGGFINIRHNEIRDLTTKLLNEVCHDVATEPVLTPLSGETLPRSSNQEDNARCDISARGFWNRGRKAYFDVKVLNPLANTYLNQTLKATIKYAEAQKRRKYNSRILNIEHGSFTPLVFSCIGGFGEEAKRFYNRLAELVAEKRSSDTEITKNVIRTELSFSLLRTSILCIRGSRSHKIRSENLDNEIDPILAHI